jgi:HlyD family secretion protein
MGKVKRIDMSGVTKRSSLGVEEQRVNIITSIENNPKANLGVGYRLQAQFLTSPMQKHVLLVPRFSILNDAKGNNYVFKVAGKKLQKQIIKTGVETNMDTEVLSGLSVSDKIVAEPTAEMG